MRTWQPGAGRSKRSRCEARPSERGGVAELRRTSERGSNEADRPFSATCDRGDVAGGEGLAERFVEQLVAVAKLAQTRRELVAPEPYETLLVGTDSDQHEVIEAGVAELSNRREMALGVRTAEIG